MLDVSGPVLSMQHRSSDPVPKGDDVLRLQDERRSLQRPRQGQQQGEVHQLFGEHRGEPIRVHSFTGLSISQEATLIVLALIGFLVGSLDTSSG